MLRVARTRITTGEGPKFNEPNNPDSDSDPEEAEDEQIPSCKLESESKSESFESVILSSQNL